MQTDARKGPVLLQETKWDGNQQEILLQTIPGVQIACTQAIPTPKDRSSGGVSILLPAGWTVENEHILLKGRAVAILYFPFYLMSVYLHPKRCKCELEDVLTEWRKVDKKSERVVVAGDFNNIDKFSRVMESMACHYECL